MRLPLLALFLLFTSPVWAQKTPAYVVALSGTIAAKPTTCTIGEQYFATDAPAGANLYFCTATNTWTASGGSGTVATGTIGNCAQYTASTTVGSTGSPCGGINTIGTSGPLPLFGGYTFYMNGGTIYARNNTTLTVDYSGTDATVVVNNAINNIASTCGRLDFKDGVYPFNSLLQESTGGFSNYYAIRLPSQAATNQYCTWEINGESWTPIMGYGIPSPQTSGVIFNVTSTAISSVALHSKIMDIWVQKDATNGVGPSVSIKNIDVRFPTNQRGCETGIDLSNALNSFLENVNVDTTVVPPPSIVFPVEDTCTAWGFTDKGGLVGAVTTNSEKQSNIWTNVNTWGADEGIDDRSELSTFDQVYANYGNYGIEYGVNSGGGLAIFFPSTWQNFGCQVVARCLTLGTNINAGAELEGHGMSMQDGAGAFAPVYHVSDLSAGKIGGKITYTRVAGGALVSLPYLCDGTACGDMFTFNATNDIVTYPNYSVAGLPTGLHKGSIAIVVDALSASIGTCVGGGTNTVIAVYSGTSWICQ